jgi:hypothetical protein
MCCPSTGVSTLLPTETGVGLTGWSEDPASPWRFPDKTGLSPKTPSVVFRTFELSPEDDALIQSYSDLHNTSAPFRLLPIRAPTSGKLRISFWLAPSFGHRPTFDRPVKKTRDVSNRLLPLIRTTCTRTSRVPDSLRELLRVDVPQRLRLRTT